jgi:hypothetical protein
MLSDSAATLTANPIEETLNRARAVEVRRLILHDVVDCANARFITSRESSRVVNPRGTPKTGKQRTAGCKRT